MKTCSSCGEEKDYSEFHKRKGAKDGLRDQCKECKNQVRKKWESENIEKVRLSKNRYKINNPDKVREADYNWRENNREAYNEIQRRWRRNNPERYKECKKRYDEANIEIERARKREYMRENSGYYSQKNLERQKRLDREDPDFRYARSLRASFRNVLHGRNSKKMAHLNYWELIKKIEMQFVEGMDWSNYGTAWHIDHKKPMIRFFRQGEYRPSIIYALSNLQPLWASENCSKQDTFH